MNVSCQTYPSPIPFSELISYQFTCIPPAGLNVSGVMWRRFDSEDAVEQFQITQNGTLGTEMAGNGTLNEILMLSAQASAEKLAYFYVPSFIISGMEIPTAETSIFGEQ